MEEKASTRNPHGSRESCHLEERREQRHGVHDRELPHAVPRPRRQLVPVDELRTRRPAPDRQGRE